MWGTNCRAAQSNPAKAKSKQRKSRLFLTSYQIREEASKKQKRPDYGWKVKVKILKNGL